MPNWCDNAATITASKDKIDGLVAVLENKEDQQVFQYLRPRPESEEDNWYNWNVTNWGTKWEISIIDYERYDDETVWISFETAWAPPIALYEFMHENEWYVDAVYNEGGCAFAGIWKDGEDDFYEYDCTDLSSLEALPEDIKDFTGLVDYYHSQQEELEAQAEYEEEEATKTQWFDPTIKPVHVGRYEAKDPEHPNWPFAEYADWDGKKWVNGDGKKIKIGSWRGLREDPNGS